MDSTISTHRNIHWPWCNRLNAKIANWCFCTMPNVLDMICAAVNHLSRMSWAVFTVCFKRFLILWISWPCILHFVEIELYIIDDNWNIITDNIVIGSHVYTCNRGPMNMRTSMVMKSIVIAVWYLIKWTV